LYGGGCIEFRNNRPTATMWEGDQTQQRKKPRQWGKERKVVDNDLLDISSTNKKADAKTKIDCWNLKVDFV
jgi:hypothetical protein